MHELRVYEQRRRQHGHHLKSWKSIGVREIYQIKQGLLDIQDSVLIMTSTACTFAKNSCAGLGLRALYNTSPAWREPHFELCHLSPPFHSHYLLNLPPLRSPARS